MSIMPCCFSAVRIFFGGREHSILEDENWFVLKIVTVMNAIEFVDLNKNGFESCDAVSVLRVEHDVAGPFGTFEFANEGKDLDCFKELN